jgi:Ca2+-binding RTX toxin-like protein
VTVNLGLAGPQNTVGEGNDTLSNFENLLGSDFNDMLTGNASANVITGGLGNDTLDGAGGADTLIGGLGNDTYVVDNASDVVTEASGQGTDQVNASVSYTLGANVENLNLLGTAAINGTGNAGANTITGNSGANILDGGGGSDTLIGGLGNDTYVVHGSETIVENAGEGIDTIQANFSYVMASANVENLTLTGASAINGTGDGADNSIRGNSAANVLPGGAGDDYLYGNAGNDTLTGGDGYDRMYGGTGDDTYYVNDATDFAYENADEGHDSVISSIDLTLRANVEDLTLTGAAYIGKGNILDNAISGTDLANKLYGYEGNDTLNGNGGDDYLFGAEGNDTLIGGSGYDRMYGGTGDDTYYVNDTTDFAYENPSEGNDRVFSSLVSYQLRANVEELDLVEGSAAIRGYGQAGDNLIVGNSADNFLYGRDGNDHLMGGGGADILYGENGNDVLEGGAGMDRFYGGTGADTFLFRDGDFAGMTSGTADRIHDFSQVDGDKLDFSNVDANTLLGGDQAFSFIGNAAFGHHAGELRYYQQSGVTYVAGDTNGDGVADFAVRIDGLFTIHANDLVL